MGCSCGRQHESKAGPGDSCIYCVEKHLCLAQTIVNSLGIAAGSRQMILGDLELARRHAASAYTDIASCIAELEQMLISRSIDDFLTKLSSAISLCANVIAKIKYSSDEASGVYSDTPSTIKYNPVAGELYLSCAARLAAEDGYYDMNRSMLIGELVAAQYHLSGISNELHDKLLGLRKRISVGERAGENEWLELLVDADAVVTEAIHNGADTDIGWYIHR